MLVLGLYFGCPPQCHAHPLLVSLCQKFSCFWQVFACGFVTLVHTLVHTHTHTHKLTHSLKYIQIHILFLAVHIPFSLSHTHTYTFIKYPLRPLICFHFLANAQVLLPQFSISWQIYPVVWSFTNYSSNDSISLVNCGVPIIFSSKGLLPPSLFNTHILSLKHTHT